MHKIILPQLFPLTHTKIPTGRKSNVFYHNLANRKIEIYGRIVILSKSMIVNLNSFI